MGPTGSCIRVILGVGEANCDVARNFNHHYSYRRRALAVAREVRPLAAPSIGDRTMSVLALLRRAGLS
jgi:hypothetical protein